MGLLHFQLPVCRECNTNDPSHSTIQCFMQITTAIYNAVCSINYHHTIHFFKYKLPLWYCVVCDKITAVWFCVRCKLPWPLHDNVFDKKKVLHCRTAWHPVCVALFGHLKGEITTNYHDHSMIMCLIKKKVLHCRTICELDIQSV